MLPRAPRSGCSIRPTPSGRPRRSSRTSNRARAARGRPWQRPPPGGADSGSAADDGGSRWGRRPDTTPPGSGGGDDAADSGGGTTTTVYKYVVDVTFTANGRMRKIKGLDKLDMLPSQASPLLIFMGVTSEGGARCSWSTPRSRPPARASASRGQGVRVRVHRPGRRARLHAGRRRQLHRAGRRDPQGRGKLGPGAQRQGRQGGRRPGERAMGSRHRFVPQSWPTWS